MGNYEAPIPNPHNSSYSNPYRPLRAKHKAQDQAALSEGIQLIPGHDAPGVEFRV